MGDFVRKASANQVLKIQFVFRMLTIYHHLEVSIHFYEIIQKS